MTDTHNMPLEGRDSVSELANLGGSSSPQEGGLESMLQRHGGSHFSASPERSLPGCWRG